MRAPIHRLAALVLAGLLASGTAARADDEASPPEVSEETKAKAKEHFVRGRAHHEAGAYEEAAAAYLASYEIYPHPVLLYNVAQVKRLGGDAEGALEYYRKYLELEPEGKVAERARGFAAKMEAALASGQPEKPEGSEEEEEGEAIDPATHEGAEGDPDPEGAEAPGGAKPMERGKAPPAEGGSRGRGKRLTGLAVAGVGVLSLALGVKFGLDARSLSEEASSLRGTYDPDAHRSIYDDGEAAERNMLVFTGVGVLAVAGGGALYYLGVRDARVAPAAGSGGGGIVVSGRF